MNARTEFKAAFGIVRTLCKDETTIEGQGREIAIRLPDGKLVISCGFSVFMQQDVTMKMCGNPHDGQLFAAIDAAVRAFAFRLYAAEHPPVAAQQRIADYNSAGEYIYA